MELNAAIGFIILALPEMPLTAASFGTSLASGPGRPVSSFSRLPLRVAISAALF
jgi:hypothetical protein